MALSCVSIGELQAEESDAEPANVLVKLIGDVVAENEATVVLLVNRDAFKDKLQTGEERIFVAAGGLELIALDFVPDWVTEAGLDVTLLLVGSFAGGAVGNALDIPGVNPDATGAVNAGFGLLLR